MSVRRSEVRGMALVAVLWMVAALSVIATGMLRSVKGEIRVTGQQTHGIVAGALADAAIRRVLQDVVAQRPAIDRPIHIETPLSGRSVTVTVKPLNGLIDINKASKALLTALFQRGAGQSTGRSAELAASVVHARSLMDAQGRPVGFDAPEDLLQVPGIDYPLYARIVGLFAVGLGGDGRVNPQAASLQMLNVLSKGDYVPTRQPAAYKGGADYPMDITQFNGDFIDTSSISAVQLSARVQLADGAALVRSWRVRLFPSAQTGLPWQMLEVLQHIEPQGS